jgi:hypothetical protein
VGEAPVKINLTWWRKRPSVHVADEDWQMDLWNAQNARLGIVDMNNAILMLDPDLSQFSTMLTQLANPGYEEITVDKIYGIEVGTTLRFTKDGMIRRVESIRRATSDDWFAPDQWILGVRKPWVTKPETYKVKHFWLEDEFMPRLKNSILTNITG